MALLINVAANCGDDKLIPHIVWQNLHPLLEKQSAEFVDLVSKTNLRKSPGLTALLPRAIDRMLANRSADIVAVSNLLHTLVLSSMSDSAVAHQLLLALADRIQSGEIAGSSLAALRQHLLPIAQEIMASEPDGPLYLDAALLAVTLKDPAARETVRKVFTSTNQPEQTRLRALEALLKGGDREAIKSVATALADVKRNSPRFRGQVLAALGRRADSSIAATVLTLYPRMEKDVQPRAIELLTQRTSWSKQLLQAVADKKISPDALNVNQVRKLLASKDPELVKQVRAHWGTVRDGRNPEREKVVAEMRAYLGKQRGDPMAGWKVFKNVCAQCHKIYGEGVDVGPDITSNGRSDFNQLLSNVFDPSLVIGAGYQATTVLTTKGQALTGLVVEDNAQRVVLKTQGGKLEIIPRGDVESLTVSQVSLMPEGLEKQLRPQEIADLFAFLTLDRPPSEPQARLIAGTPR